MLGALALRDTAGLAPGRGAPGSCSDWQFNSGLGAETDGSREGTGLLWSYPPQGSPPPPERQLVAEPPGLWHQTCLCLVFALSQEVSISEVGTLRPHTLCLDRPSRCGSVLVSPHPRHTPRGTRPDSGEKQMTNHTNNQGWLPPPGSVGAGLCKLRGTGWTVRERGHSLLRDLREQRWTSVVSGVWMEVRRDRKGAV